MLEHRCRVFTGCVGKKVLRKHSLRRKNMYPRESSTNEERESEPHFHSAWLENAHEPESSTEQNDSHIEAGHARVHVSNDDLDIATHPQLKDMCKILGLKVSGKKKDLTDRIRADRTGTTLSHVLGKGNTLGPCYDSVSLESGPSAVSAVGYPAVRGDNLQHSMLGIEDRIIQCTSTHCRKGCRMATNPGS